MDVGQNASSCDSHVEAQFVELFIISDGKLDVPGDDAAKLVISGSVSSKLNNLGCEVLQG